MKKNIFSFAFILLLLSSSSFGQKYAYKHDGFFLRMLAGPGYAELVDKDVMGSDLKFSSLGTATRFQIGGVISENLIIYGEFGGVGQLQPKVEWMGETTTVGRLSVFVYDFGGGITYYLMPVNVYFSFSLYTSGAALEYFGGEYESGSGFGLNAMIGKEWWISYDWALGAAIYGYYSTMEEERGFTINNFSVGVLFSATYN